MKKIKPFKEYFEDEYEEKNPPYSLFNCIETLSTIKCTDCKIEETTEEDGSDAMDSFYANGWRMKGPEQPICKKCRLKMNKLAKKNRI